MLVSQTQATQTQQPQDAHKVFNETQLKVMKDSSVSVKLAAKVGIVAALMIATVALPIAAGLFLPVSGLLFVGVFLGGLVGSQIIGAASGVAIHALAEMVKNSNLRNLTIKKLAKEDKFTDLFRINDILTDKEKYLVRRLFLERLKEINKQINIEITDADLVNRPAGIAKGDLLVEKLGALRQYKESLINELIKEVPKPVRDGNEAIEEIIRKLRKVGLVIKLGNGIVAAIPGRIKNLEEAEQAHAELLQKLGRNTQSMGKNKIRNAIEALETVAASLKKASEKNEGEKGPAPTAPYAPAVEGLGGKSLGYNSATPAFPACFMKI